MKINFTNRLSQFGHSVENTEALVKINAAYSDKMDTVRSIAKEMPLFLDLHTSEPEEIEVVCCLDGIKILFWERGAGHYVDVGNPIDESTQKEFVAGALESKLIVQFSFGELLPDNLGQWEFMRPLILACWKVGAAMRSQELREAC